MTRKEGTERWLRRFAYGLLQPCTACCPVLNHAAFQARPTLPFSTTSNRDYGLRGCGNTHQEDIDFGISPSSTLLVGIDGPTPTAVPGAATIHTSELVRLIENRPLLIDDAVGSWGRSLAGAIGLQGAGHGAAMSNDLQARLMRTIGNLTGGKLQMPIVVFSINSERFAGYNLALRLVALGYTNVYWYRGGLEAWPGSPSAAGC